MGALKVVYFLLENKILRLIAIQGFVSKTIKVWPLPLSLTLLF